MLPKAGPAWNRLQVLRREGEENDNVVLPFATRCIASACMAWRWAGWEQQAHGTIAPAPLPADRTGPRLGYCGLAGKPWGAP